MGLRVKELVPIPVLPLTLNPVGVIGLSDIGEGEPLLVVLASHGGWGEMAARRIGMGWVTVSDRDSTRLQQ